MDPPLPSQASQATTSTLFSNPDGSSICVFVQIVGVVGRGRILKDLKFNGATLSHDIRTAQIMLVDPETDQGRQDIRNWGKDVNKTVLNYTWVKKSLKAGRPLLEDDHWGDCLAFDDGGPIDVGELGADEHMLNPLPTPRVTPDELAQSHSALAGRRSSLNHPTQLEMQQGSIPPPSPSPASSTFGFGTPNEAISSAQHPFMAGMSSMATGFPSMAIQNAAMLATMSNLQPQPAATMTSTAQMAMMASLMMNPEFSQVLSDVMRNNGLSQQTGFQGQPWLPMTHPPILPMQSPPLPFPSVPSTQPNSSTRRFMSHDTGISPSPLLGPSISRRSSSSDLEPLNASVKGKGRADASHTDRKVSWSSANGSTSTARPVSQKSIFTSRSGRPLQFYVQVEMHGRLAVCNAIKKNGGKITQSPSTGDFAVLNPVQRPKDFNELLLSAHSAGKLAVKADFVHDCVAQGELLDPEPYLYEDVVKRKRKRSLSVVSVPSVESEDESGADDIETKRLEKNRREVERRQQKRDEDAQVKKSKIACTRLDTTPAKAIASPVKPRPRPRPISRKKETTHSTATIIGPRTPTPPAEHTRQPWGNGYKFSPVEDEYAIRYGKILVDRDHETSLNAVATAIHKQLPHHTLPSWRTHFANIADFDNWRKRAGIAHRKAESQKVEPEHATTLIIADAEVEDDPIATSPSIVRNDKQQLRDDLEDDTNTIVQFFVEGNDTDTSEPESVVWARLASMARCKTEAKWETFYEKNEEEVTRRFREANVN